MNRRDQPKKAYLDNLDVIDRIVTHLCIRYGLSREEAEDFRSSVHVKLLDQDYAVLRKHRGESSLKTYLASVIHHFFQDYRNGRLGKWRPSAAARRLGQTAILLERLTLRDGRGFDEACQIIQTNHGQEVSLQELQELHRQLPLRNRRVDVGEESLQEMASPNPGADEVLINQERQSARSEACRVVADTLADMDQEDRVMIKMHYEQGVSIAGIARTMDQSQRRLYSRMEKIKDSLKAGLAKVGIIKDDLGDFFY